MALQTSVGNAGPSVSEYHDFDRFNSYLRRTTTRHRTTTSHSDQSDAFTPDFLNFVTAVATLYSQDGVLPMQQLDTSDAHAVGSGAVFQVSSILTESTLPSQLMADEVVRENLKVILKRSPTQLFSSNGKACDNDDARRAASSFLMELRVLTHPKVRAHPFVVDILGLNWEYNRSGSGLIEPSLLLEQAWGTMDDFLKSHPKLPFDTKKDMGLDVAEGLLALHRLGVVHGDIKPDNVLMFEYPKRWTAKIADFSHSILDTGETRHLVGGTQAYAAPEWKEKLATGTLLKTDVYSYGLLFGSIMAGFDIIQHFLGLKKHGRTPAERLFNLEHKKKSGSIRTFVTELIYEADDADLISRRDEMEAAESLINNALDISPEKRDLRQFLLWGRPEPLNISHGPTNEGGFQKYANPTTTIIQTLDADIMTIPYHAFNGMSNLLKKQLVEALLYVSSDENSERNASACFELCTCYASGLGVETDFDAAFDWLVLACQRNEIYAKANIYSLATAFNCLEKLQQFPTEKWLSEAVENGSLNALRSLRTLGSTRYPGALRIYREKFSNNLDYSDGSTDGFRRFPPFSNDFSSLHSSIDAHGNNFLHYVAAKGTEALLRTWEKREMVDDSILNQRNEFGDTPLICACRAGYHRIAHQLLQYGASAKLSNNFGENALHFLPAIDDGEVELLANLLYEAGADLTQEASRTSMFYSPLDSTPFVSGCPMVRAATLDKRLALRAMFRIQAKNEGRSTMKEITIQRANLGKMLAWACCLQNYEVMKILWQERDLVLTPEYVRNLTFWKNKRRYSLLALTIAGCTSSVDKSGFNVPDRFWRCVQHGSEYLRNLQKTLELLRLMGIDFNNTICRGERNALFYAIREGRTDVVRLLLAHNEEGPARFDVFGIDKPKPPAFSSSAASNDNANRILLNQRQKSRIADAVKLAIRHGYHEIFADLLRTRESEALESGPRCRVMYKWWKSFIIDFFFSDFQDASEYFPENVGRNVFFYPTNWVTRYLDWIGLNLLLSDGSMNYGLLYMSVITTSTHRDISFARTLIEALANKGIRNHLNWVPASYLEQCCLPESVPPPLLAAASNKWDELVLLLLEAGADPRALFFHPSRRTTSALHLIKGSYILPSPLRAIIYRLFGEFDLVADGGWPTFVEILHTMLIDKDPRSLDAVRRLLWLSRKAQGSAILPKPEELEALLKRDLDPSSHEDSGPVEEIWKEFCEARDNPRLRQQRKASWLVITAISRYNHVALRSLIELGYPPNGPWLTSLICSPIDIMSYKFNKQFPASQKMAHITSLESDSFHKARAKFEDCRMLLESFGVSRGPMFLWEFHLIMSLLIWALSIAVTVVTLLLSVQLDLLANSLLSMAVSLITLEPVTGIFFQIMVWLYNILCLMPLYLAIMFPFLKYIGLGNFIPFLVASFFLEGTGLTFLFPSISIVTVFLGGSVAEVCAEFRGPTTALFRRLFPAIKQQVSDSEEARSRLVEFLCRRATVKGANGGNLNRDTSSDEAPLEREEVHDLPLVSLSDGANRPSALQERSPISNPIGEERELERRLGWRRRGLRGWNLFQEGGSIYSTIGALLNFGTNYITGSFGRSPRLQLPTFTDYDETSDADISLLESQELEQEST